MGIDAIITFGWYDSQALLGQNILRLIVILALASALELMDVHAYVLISIVYLHPTQ